VQLKRGWQTARNDPGIEYHAPAARGITMANEQFGEKEKIQILALEYSSLRSEINVRNSSIYQVAAVFGLVSVWILSQPWGTKLLIGGCLALIGFFICGWFITRDSIKAAIRVQDLEQEINRRAGEKLLVWESELGGLPHGYWQFRYFFRLLRSRKKAERGGKT
jgi:hypothetical protein